ncbi:MAG: RNA polymerase sigma factor [Verrucomicrobia bacterium]|nr:RNA polymerase sigma factor [Verrucomicrobiota bacterium]
MSDLSEFEGFMRQYQDMVFTVARRLLGNAADAEDVAQEAFLRAYRHFDRLRDSPAAGGWLRTVARNLAINHLTRYRNRWRFFSEMGPEDGVESPREANRFEANLPAPETHSRDTARLDRLEILDRALDRLPPTQRAALALYHFEGLSYEEIAARLKVSLAKIKSDIYRARTALRRRLAAQKHNLLAE